MTEQPLATLQLDGNRVADYVRGTDLDARWCPRPHLHPVRTLGGTVVTDAVPSDHPWHLGAGVALQDVDGWNLWGGPTYVRDEGYLWQDDHGRIDHDGFEQVDDHGFTERLHWRTPSGRPLLAERRRVAARLAAPGWELLLATTLLNPTERPLRLGSPATNGRAGAGYGGLFWRLPPAATPRVWTPLGTGEEAVHGSSAPWLAWTDAARGYSLVLAGGDAATASDAWFVRAQEYPGIGLQLASREPLVVPPGTSLTRTLRALVLDGPVSDAVAADWTRSCARSRTGSATTS
jgi:ribosomal protein L34